MVDESELRQVELNLSATEIFLLKSEDLIYRCNGTCACNVGTPTSSPSHFERWSIDAVHDFSAQPGILSYCVAMCPRYTIQHNNVFRYVIRSRDLVWTRCHWPTGPVCQSTLKYTKFAETFFRDLLLALCAGTRRRSFNPLIAYVYFGSVRHRSAASPFQCGQHARRPPHWCFFRCSVSVFGSWHLHIRLTKVVLQFLGCYERSDLYLLSTIPQ